MIIRQASLDAFKQMAIEAFEEEMVEHCKKFSPSVCKQLGSEALLVAVRQGLRDARARGFEQRGSLQFDLDCTLLFGIGFATDPQYPWLAAVLARSDFDEELLRSEAVYEAVKSHLESVAGTDDRYVRGCLRRILRLFQGELPVRIESFGYDVAQIFERLHPEKSQAAGSSSIQALLGHVLARGRDEYGLTGARSLATLAILMWFSGYRCDEDPFRPWIRDALATRAESGSEAAGALLEKRAMNFFETLLEELT